jgi:UDP-N-acetyl-D-glucosamine dehydrogenase
MKVVILGLGYVGLVIAVRAAEVGHEVVGVEPDAHQRLMLWRGESYIEDVTDEQLKAIRNNFGVVGGGSALKAIENFDVAIITVPTPLRDGVPDLTYVKSASEMLAPYIKPGASVVLESTTYPGTTEGILADTIHRHTPLLAGIDFHLGFSPERIDPGNKIDTFQTTPKLVSATTTAGLQAIKRFYDSVVDTTVPVSSPRVAEITKIYENHFANTNIALVNELAKVCHLLDIDVWEMIAAGQTKGHSMQPWYPGPGVGGHCLPIDPMYLGWQTQNQLNTPFQFGQLSHEINSRMPDYTVNRAMDLLNQRGMAMSRSKVLVIGVTYKPGSNDMRESPSIPLIKGLIAKGASVVIADPHVGLWDLTPRTDGLSGAADYDLVIIATAHPEYDYAKLAATAQQIFDTRRAVAPGENVVHL